MVASAWLFNDDGTDQRELHQFTPNREVTFEDLAKFGVYYQRIDVDQPDYMEKIEALSKERSYKNRDFINIAKDTLPNYDEKLKIFFTEHLHEDEEIRFILAGQGYFDVRAPNDEWVRISMGAGDLIVLPAGIYHRFTLDTTNYLKAMRLFKEDPKWTPINRSEEADKNSFRVQYVESLLA
ncbi:1,2-dihydroxy-3-keto-5-methylthiopentene dioxygenase [Irineochytrium annulatum]|nr:1,2-dihydroxy-3-keto-5-methylthiopentene dioxygenase [Irineochytrium annulatum]